MKINAKILQNITMAIICLGALYSCTDNPTSGEAIPTELSKNNGNIAKIEIWNTDITTARKSNLLEETLFNRSGSIVRHTVYNPETGSLSKEAVFTYESNTSIEIQRIIESGGTEQKVRNEYVFNSSGQIETKKSFDNTGSVISIEDFDYDVNGNILNSTLDSQNDKQTFRYEYTYDSGGLIETRSVLSDNIVISRDSMFRNAEANTLTIFSFKEESQFQSKTIFRYNNRGDIVSEMVLGKNNEILERKLYQYLYHRN